MTPPQSQVPCERLPWPKTASVNLVSTGNSHAFTQICKSLQLIRLYTRVLTRRFTFYPSSQLPHTPQSDGRPRVSHHTVQVHHWAQPKPERRVVATQKWLTMLHIPHKQSMPLLVTFRSGSNKSSRYLLNLTLASTLTLASWDSWNQALETGITHLYLHVCIQLILPR